MAIAKNPQRNRSITIEKSVEEQAEAFISGVSGTDGSGAASGAAESGREEQGGNKKPIMVRVDPEILVRIDRAAKRLGISRSAFIVSSAVERLERME